MPGAGLEPARELSQRFLRPKHQGDSEVQKYTRVHQLLEQRPFKEGLFSHACIPVYKSYGTNAAQLVGNRSGLLGGGPPPSPYKVVRVFNQQGLEAGMVAMRS